MSISFYTDTHIAKQVAIQLRRRGIEVIRCEEIGMAEAADPDHLRYAAQHGLSLITKDEDFLILHHQWLKSGQNHAGIFYCPIRFNPAIGKIVTACADYHALIDSGAGTLEDIRNRIVFI